MSYTPTAQLPVYANAFSVGGCINDPAFVPGDPHAGPIDDVPVTNGSVWLILVASAPELGGVWVSDNIGQMSRHPSYTTFASMIDLKVSVAAGTIYINTSWWMNQTSGVINVDPVTFDAAAIPYVGQGGQLCSLAVIVGDTVQQTFSIHHLHNSENVVVNDAFFATLVGVISISPFYKAIAGPSTVEYYFTTAPDPTSGDILRVIIQST